MNRQLQISVKHAFGFGSSCDHLELLNLPDEHGTHKENLLHAVGQHVALLRIDDGEMKFLTSRSKEVRRIFAFSLSHDKKIIAVSERWSALNTANNFFKQSDDASSEGQIEDRTKQQGFANISIYDIASETRLKVLSFATLNTSTHFTSVTFSPDSKYLAAVTSGGSQTSTDQPSIALWHWEKEQLETSTTVLSGSVSHLDAATVANGKLCLSTSGSQHLKLWLFTESGLKMQSLLPSPEERSEDFVDHKWTELKVSSSSRRPNLRAHFPDNDACHHRLLVLGKGSKSRSTQGFSSKGESWGDGKVFLFEGIDTLPFLELRCTIRIPLSEHVQLETMVVFSRGFCVAGTNGFFGAYESRDDPKNPYMHVHCSNIDGFRPDGARPSWKNLAVSVNRDMLVARSRDNALYTFPLGTMDVMDADIKSGFGEYFSPLFLGGLPHEGSILAMDLGIHRPLVATCGADGTIRIWNYVNKKCELIFGGERGKKLACNIPTSLAIHPSGFQLLIGFPERLNLYSILFNRLKILYELPLMKCHGLKYAHGGHQFACAAGMTIYIFSAISMAQLYAFSGHVLAVHCVVWAADDLSIFSAGVDGNVFGWDLVNNSRIEEASQLSCVSPYHALAVHIPSRGVHIDTASGHSLSHPRIIASADGVLSEVRWKYGTLDSAQSRSMCVRELSPSNLLHGTGFEAMKTSPQNSSFLLTALALSPKEAFLYAGTCSGALRVYSWPLSGGDGAQTDFLEFPLHDGAIVALRTSNEESLLISAAADGVIFVLRLQVCEGIKTESRAAVDLDCHALVSRLSPSIVGEFPLAHAADVVQVSLEELEDSNGAVVYMRRQLENLKSENEFALHRKNLDWEDNLKIIEGEREKLLANEHLRFEHLQVKFENSMQEHRNEMFQKESNYVQVTHELENQYEHRLSLELERYDALSEEIETTQQRCEGLLQAQAVEHESLTLNAEGRTKRVEKELRQQIDRLHEDAKHNEQMFREVLDQQEHEYETELQHLMAAAQAELTSERENTSEARGLVQARNTKISRLEKRMDELKTSSHARNVLLTAEKVRNAKLEATLRHFKRHMEERESTLEDKELAIINLRRKNVTLDNFRFVLDHRVQQLMEERGPITYHVNGLEAHISAMYDELEAEYYEKKRQGQQLDSKELKMHTLGQEVATLQGLLRERQAYIASFKRELSTLVGLTTPKDREDAIKNAYHKFVKEEAPRRKSSKKSELLCIDGFESDGSSAVIRLTERSPGGGKDGTTSSAQGNVTSEETEVGLLSSSVSHGMGQLACNDLSRRKIAQLELRDALIEAHSQRNCVQRAAGNLKHRLNTAKYDARRLQNVKLGENSHLITECNELRGENSSLSRELNHLRQVVKDQNVYLVKKRDKLHTADGIIDTISNQESKKRMGSGLINFHPIAVSGGTFKGIRNQATSHAEKVTTLQSWCGSRGNSRPDSEQGALIIQMLKQLDENTQLIETQKIEINQLRGQFHR